MKKDINSSSSVNDSVVPKGYKQTEVGVIPEDWDVDQIGDAFEICNNLRLPISQIIREKMDGQFPYYGPTSIQGYINEFRIEGEYALIGEDGDHFLKWQHQSMTQLVKGRFNVNNHAHIVKGIDNLTAWFYYYYSHKDITSYLTRQGAGRYKLTKSTLQRIPCALPPTLTEQQAIAGALSDADALIESLEQIITKKRNIKQGAMQELLTGKRRLPGFTGEWEVKKLGDVITEISDGGTPSTSNFNNFGGSICWVVIEDIRDEIYTTRSTLTEQGLQSCAAKLWQPGTLIISTGATIGEVGIARIPLATKQGICGLVVDPTADNIFLKYWFVANKSLILSKAQGSTIKEVRAPTLVQFEIRIPKVVEQSAIAAILSDMDEEITALESKLFKARQVKQGMMQELLTGRIRLV